MLENVKEQDEMKENKKRKRKKRLLYRIQDHVIVWRNPPPKFVLPPSGIPLISLKFLHFLSPYFSLPPKWYVFIFFSSFYLFLFFLSCFPCSVSLLFILRDTSDFLQNLLTCFVLWVFAGKDGDLVCMLSFTGALLTTAILSLTSRNAKITSGSYCQLQMTSA